MTFDDAILKIRGLLEQRDQVDAELSGLLRLDAPTHPVRRKEGRGDRRVAPENPARSSGRKRPLCSICGQPGHNVATCPQGKGLHPNNPKEPSLRKQPDRESENATDPKAKRIKEFLKNGHDDDFTASETGTSPRVVAFYRKQMQSRGEI